MRNFSHSIVDGVYAAQPLLGRAASAAIYLAAAIVLATIASRLGL